MTKKDIATALAERIARLDISTAISVVDSLSDIMSEAFASGQNVYIRGFGTFQVKQAKEKPARDIRAAKQILVPSQRLVRFKASDILKSRLNPKE